MSTLELRTYTIAPGRAEALFARFRDHTIGLFGDHGMISVGYWTPIDRPDQLVYLLRHVGDPAANWDGFRVDPRWMEARQASVADGDGELTLEISSTLLQENELSRIIVDL